MVLAHPGQFILLPREGFRADTGPALNALASLPPARSTEPPAAATLEAAAGRTVKVIDTVSENGPKLVELEEDAAVALSDVTSPLRAVPVVEYARPNPRPQPLGGPSIGAAASLTNVVITCTDAQTGAALASVDVVAFTSFAQRSGDQGTTDSSGNVTLRLAGASIERLYVYAPPGLWGAFRQATAIQRAISVALSRVDLTVDDCVRYYYGNSNFDRQTGVRVGVIDTGVGPHRDLNVVSGVNTVTGEPANDYQDGDIHGTHVAGLIGADGAPPTGLRGVAPGVALYVYRVFGRGASGATNYAILKAMILAADAKCDIINLSLGGGPYDEIVSEAIQDARNQGMLVVIAAGNNGRQAVSYPAAYLGATAVTATGREGTFPAGSLEEGEILRPPYSQADAQEFIAQFSNIGPQVALTGPGVGALSTLPGNAFGPLSGTSMAAPVAAGAAACLLSRDSVLYSMQRDRTRSNAIEQLLQSNCVRRGFGSVYEGYGLPDPSAV